MKISVIGCGYLGAVHAAAMADLGHEVVGIDTEPKRIAELQVGAAPFFEPGLPDLLERARSSGRLKFANDMADARGSRVHFICVGTPQKSGDNSADLRFVDSAVRSLIPYLTPGDVVVGKSTVPVGTASRLALLVAREAPEVHLAWNPEFLREGHAVHDTFDPDRLVYGVQSGDAGHPAVVALDTIYGATLSAGTPRLVMDLASAELVKTAANSFLATKISFINAMAEVCEASGADVTVLADAIGLDDRIGRKFLNAGAGFGGGCLPKDIRGFMARARELGADQALTFLREVDAINMRRRSKIVEATRELCGGSLMGRRVTVLGASFKPESDDVRDSPALDIAAQLKLQGAAVIITDPEALPNAAMLFPELTFEPDLKSALDASECVVLLTEWDQYRFLDPVETGYLVDNKVILDGRNVLSPVEWREAGWRYRGIGRP